MSITDRIARALAGLVVGVALLALAAAPANAADEPLTGEIHIHNGVPAETGDPGGSWVRIQEPGEDPETDPYLENSSSFNPDKTYTLLEGGWGELHLGAYQDDTEVNAGEIVEPRLWGTPPFAAPFEIYTSEEDPAGAKEGSFPAPELEYDSETGEVTGDLRSWTVNFGGAWFNQGANSVEPGDIDHPDGNLHGEYDPLTGHIVLTWSSLIVDNYGSPHGPFNDHVGHWRIEGTVEPPPES